MKENANLSLYNTIAVFSGDFEDGSVFTIDLCNELGIESWTDFPLLTPIVNNLMLTGNGLIYETQTIVMNHTANWSVVIKRAINPQLIDNLNNIFIKALTVKLNNSTLSVRDKEGRVKLYYKKATISDNSFASRNGQDGNLTTGVNSTVKFNLVNPIR